MAFKLIIFAAFVAVARAGVIGLQSHGASYSAATDVSYSTLSLPAVSKVAAAPVYAAPALRVAAPVYQTQALKVAAPIYQAQPLKIAAPLAYSAPIAKTVVAEQYAPAQYEFGYAVNDPHTGDSKSQEEHREGDVVKGSYSLIEADGSRRIVHYTADHHNGFNAVVTNEPAKVAVKAVAPVYAKVAAPLAYAAPVAAKALVAGPVAAYSGQSYYH